MVTIVVLIILATVSINVVFDDNGLIKKAQEAKKIHETSSEREEQQLNDIFKQINWDYDIVYGKEDENGNVIPIPKGYYYVEGTKDTGFVISDSQEDENKEGASEGNQYIWVPVDDINEYELISWNGETVSEDSAVDTYY